GDETILLVVGIEIAFVLAEVAVIVVADGLCVDGQDFVGFVVRARLRHTIGDALIPIAQEVKVPRAGVRGRGHGAGGVEIANFVVGEAIKGVVGVALRTGRLVPVFFALFVAFAVELIAKARDSRGAERVFERSGPVIGIISIGRYGPIPVCASKHSIGG